MKTYNEYIKEQKKKKKRIINDGLLKIDKVIAQVDGKGK
jgi:hypothetical protein